MINIKSNSTAEVVPPYYSDIVTLRVKKGSLGKSGSGNEQIVLETEIAQPTEVEIEGLKYVIGGQTIKFYLGLSDKKAEKAKQSPLKNTQDFHEKLGLPLELDPDNLPYEGLCFEYYLQSQEKTLKRRTRTGEFEVVTDENGKPRTLGWEWSNALGNVMGPSAYQG